MVDVFWHVFVLSARLVGFIGLVSGPGHEAVLQIDADVRRAARSQTVKHRDATTGGGSGALALRRRYPTDARVHLC